MRTTALVLIVAAGSWMATASSPVVLSDLRLSKAASRAVLLPTEEFQADRLEPIARRFLEETRELPFAEMYFFDREGEATQYLSGKFVLEVAYRWWRQLYEKERERGQRPMAWALRLKQSSVMLVRDPRGAVQRRVLQGRDPLVLWMGGERWEILYVRVAEVAESLRATEGDTELDFFIRTTAPLDSPLREAVTRTLAEMSEVPNIRVKFRNDAWFINEAFFPVAYGFESAGAPIEERDYLKTRTAVCWALSGKPECELSFGKP